MKELQKSNTDIVLHDKVQKMVMQYDDNYLSKPLPRSMEMIADNRDKVATLHHIQLFRGAFTTALVTKIINDSLTKFLNVKRSMDAEMIGSLAEHIIYRFPQMTPADIRLLMFKGVSGEFGQILDRVDGALILSWCGQYWDQMKYLIRLRVKNKEAEDAKCEVPESIAELSRRLRDKMSLQKMNKVSEPHKSLREEFEERGYDLDELLKEG